MNAPARQILLQVDERVFTHLSKMAGELGRSPTRYALELFEAAYAVRCGVADDARLAAAIKDGAGPADVAASTEALDSLRAKAALVQKLESTVLRLRSDLAASQQHVRRLAAERPQERPSIDTAALDAQKGVIQNLEAELDTAGAEIRAAKEKFALEAAKVENLEEELSIERDEVRRLSALVDHWSKPFGRETERVEAAENDRSLADPSALTAAIADLKSAASDLKDAVADQKLQSDQLDQLYRRTRDVLEGRRSAAAPTRVVAAAPQPASEAPAQAPAPGKALKASPAKPPKTGFIWKKSWGQGR